MICLAHSRRNIKMEMPEDKVSVLVIENPVIMREILQELEEQMRGDPGEIILSIGYEPVSIAKSFILVSDPLNINCNDRKILTRLYQSIMDEEKIQYFVERDNFDRAYLAYLREISLLSPLPIIYDEKIDLGELLKSAHVAIDYSAGSYVENLWNYIRVMSDLFHIKIFAFMNLKCFLSEQELDLLYTQCFYEKKQLLLIESHDTPFREDEKKYIIDADGCMIYY